MSSKQAKAPSSEQPPWTERLVDYFFEIGPSVEGVKKFFSDTDNAAKQQFEVRPEVHHIYPFFQWDDYSIPEGVVALHCFPTGMYLRSKKPHAQSFNFVLADSEKRICCSCVIVYEPIDLESISSAITLLPHQKANRRIVSGAHSWFMPRAFCLVSHHPFYLNFQLFLARLYYIGMNYGANQAQNCIQKFVTGTPLPPRGYASIHFQMCSDFPVQVLSRSRLNEPEYPEVSCYRMFRALSLSVIADAFFAIMLEKTLIIRSSSISLLTEIAESLASFMYPFAWPHVFLPVLPNSLIDILQTPSPGIFGVHSSVTIPYESLEECLILDVDSNEIDHYFPLGKTPFPRLSQLVTAKRKNRLVKKLQSVLTAHRITVVPASVLNDDVSLEEDRKLQNGPMGDYLRMGPDLLKRFMADIRLEFLSFNAYVWRYYKDYLVLNRNRKSEIDAYASIDQEGYLLKASDPNRDYLYFAFQSQAFQLFIDECGKNLNNFNKMIFDDHISKTSHGLFHKADTSFIDDDRTAHTKIEIIRPKSTCSERPVTETMMRFPTLNYKRYEPPSYPGTIHVEPLDFRRTVEIKHCSGVDRGMRGTGLLEVLSHKFADSLQPTRAMTEERARPLLKANILNKDFRSAHDNIIKLLNGPDASHLSILTIHLIATTFSAQGNCKAGMLLLQHYKITNQVSIQYYELMHSFLPSKKRTNPVPTPLTLAEIIAAPEACPAYTPKPFQLCMSGAIEFHRLLRDTTIKPVAKCPHCQIHVQPQEIFLRWSPNAQNLSTSCPKCELSFNASLEVTSFVLSEQLHSAHGRPSTTPESESSRSGPVCNNGEADAVTTSNTVPVVLISDTDTQGDKEPVHSRSDASATGSSTSTSSDKLLSTNDTDAPASTTTNTGPISPIRGPGSHRRRSTMHSITFTDVTRQTATIPWLPLPAVATQIDFYSASPASKIDTANSFMMRDPLLFWNVIFVCNWLDYPLDALMPNIDWASLPDSLDEFLDNVPLNQSIATNSSGDDV